MNRGMGFDGRTQEQQHFGVALPEHSKHEQLDAVESLPQEML